MAQKVDANHWDVFRAFRARGWFVVSTADMGSGFPDLLIAKRGVLKQVEVKDGSKAPSRRRLSPDQVVYHRDLEAVQCPVLVVERVEQVAAIDAELFGASSETL